MKNYTIKKIITFFNEGERVGLKDLEKFYTIEGIAYLIKERLIERDNTMIKPKK